MPGSLQNFIYEDEGLIKEGNTKIDYELQVQMMGGSATIGMRLCQSLTKNNTIDCLINDISELQNQTILNTFKELEAEVYQVYNTYYIKFSYDISGCPNFTRHGSLYYVCDFHVLVSNTDDNKNTTTYDMYMGI